MKIHEKYMRRCLDLAKNGLGTTYPNPMVGCVIVYNELIIGEGWHKRSGEPHAEVNAINFVKDKSLLKNATIYVSLEPCSHFGKTPPCCDLIINYKIPNVVIGTVDPNIKVAGRGIQKIMESGANVTVGVLESDCLELNKRFFTFHQKKRPYIILKWAESRDGFMAPTKANTTTDLKTRQPVWITNEFSRQLVHKWRSEEQAILVGTQTVVDDNPRLDVRDWFGNNPIRIVLDKNNRIQKDSHVLDSQTKTLVLTQNRNSISDENTAFEELDFENNITSQILENLYQKNIQSILIEGGRQSLQTFIDDNLWDEAKIFIGASILKSGLKAPVIERKNSTKKNIAEDELVIIRNHD